MVILGYPWPTASSIFLVDRYPGWSRGWKTSLGLAEPNQGWKIETQGLDAPKKPHAGYTLFFQKWKTKVKRSSWNLSWLSSWNLSWLSSMNHFQHFSNLGVDLKDLNCLDIFSTMISKVKQCGPSDLYRHRGSCSGWSSECSPPQLFRLRQPLGKVYMFPTSKICSTKKTHQYMPTTNCITVPLFSFFFGAIQSSLTEFHDISKICAISVNQIHVHSTISPFSKYDWGLNPLLANLVCHRCDCLQTRT